MLRSIVGPTGAVFYDVVTNKGLDLTGEVVDIASRYTLIRATAAGFAITGSTAQSLLLFLVATILNGVGDVYLVAYKGMGVLGAAIATSFATILSNSFLIWKGNKLTKQWRLALWAEKYSYDKPPSSEKEIDAFTESIPMAQQTQSKKELLLPPFMSLPGRDSFRSFSLLAGPIFLIMLSRMVECWYMTTTANKFGFVFGDGVSQASQTFLPGLFVKLKKANAGSNGQHKANSSRQADTVIHQLSIIAASLGVLISISGWYVASNAGGLFTSDVQLRSFMSTASSLMGLNLLINPLAEMLEGVVVAAGDMRYLLTARCTILAFFLGALRFHYSGGQASEGQGGFYGSGGARVSTTETEHKPEMMALATDVENLTLVMEEVYNLEQTLEEEKAKADGGVSGKTLEISSKIKKIMTSVDVMETLKRLEVEGEPVWGLSSEERELVHDARQKVNEC
eukprot:scaffold21794_cov47-Cyclotella_meneghiniana.AAC.2